MCNWTRQFSTLWCNLDGLNYVKLIHLLYFRFQWENSGLHNPNPHLPILDNYSLNIYVVFIKLTITRWIIACIVPFSKTKTFLLYLSSFFCIHSPAYGYGFFRTGQRPNRKTRRVGGRKRTLFVPMTPVIGHPPSLVRLRVFFYFFLFFFPTDFYTNISRHALHAYYTRVFTD